MMTDKSPAKHKLQLEAWVCVSAPELTSLGMETCSCVCELVFKVP